MGLNTPSTGGGAPKDAAYVTGSSDSELTSETVVSPAGDILVSGDIDGTTALSPGFGTFTQVSADNPAVLLVDVDAQTDGSSFALIELAIDESGGTTADYTLRAAFAGVKLPAGTTIVGSPTVPLPAGAQFKIVNSADPKGSNTIRKVRAQILSP